MFSIFSMKAVGSIGANKPDRFRLFVMTPAMLPPPSHSPGTLPPNSVIAIGNGWIVPWVMSRRSTAAAGHTPSNAAAAAPLAVASNCRRDQGAATIGFCLCVDVMMMWRGDSAAAEHIARIEGDLHVLPHVVLRGRHRIGLAAAHRAHGALGRDAEIGA